MDHVPSRGRRSIACENTSPIQDRYPLFLPQPSLTHFFGRPEGVRESRISQPHRSVVPLPVHLAVNPLDALRAITRSDSAELFKYGSNLIKRQSASWVKEVRDPRVTYDARVKARRVGVVGDPNAFRDIVLLYTLLSGEPN